MKKVFLLSIFTIISLLSQNALAQNSNYKEISKTLEKIFDDDQSIRHKLSAIVQEKGYNSEEYKKHANELQEIDQRNQSIVFSLLDEQGWIGPKLISKKANRSYFYVIQHSDLKYQLKYKDIVKDAFLKGYISNNEYAMFIDRLNVGQGLCQLYGSQQGVDPLGNSYFYPTANINKLNDRRTALELPPINLKLYNALSPKAGEVVLIGHMMNQSQTVGIEEVQVFLKEEQIGRSDNRGLFQIIIPKYSDEVLTIELSKGGKTIIYPLNEDKDFFEIYAVFNE